MTLRRGCLSDPGSLRKGSRPVRVDRRRGVPSCPVRKECSQPSGITREAAAGPSEYLDAVPDPRDRRGRHPDAALLCAGAPARTSPPFEVIDCASEWACGAWARAVVAERVRRRLRTVHTAG